MKVRYLKKGEYEGPRLTIGRTYEVIGIEADDYRIINDVSDPCLYNPKQFEIIDGQEPEFWITTWGEDGERYSYPQQWNESGFFEDFHDGVQSVVKQFWSDCETLYGILKHV